MLGVPPRGRSNGELPTIAAAGFKRRISKGRRAREVLFRIIRSGMQRVAQPTETAESVVNSPQENVVTEVLLSTLND